MACRFVDDQFSHLSLIWYKQWLVAFSLATLAFFMVSAFSQPAQALSLVGNDSTEQVEETVENAKDAID
ncbi:MAG: hypothetical protein WA865_15605 [Spirulinaceae cyanobacterium]